MSNNFISNVTTALVSHSASRSASQSINQSINQSIEMLMYMCNILHLFNVLKSGACHLLNICTLCFNNVNFLQN